MRGYGFTEGQKAETRRDEPHLARSFRYSRHRTATHQKWLEARRETADGPRRQMAAQSLRPRRHPRRIYGIHARPKTVLLGIYWPASEAMTPARFPLLPALFALSPLCVTSFFFFA